MHAPDRDEPGRDVLLMATCLCDAFFDAAARATVEVLEAAGCAVTFPPAQTCCGQPPFNAGDWGSSRRMLAHTAQVFDDPRPVVIPSASCASMLREGARLAFEGHAPDPVAPLARRTWELADFLVFGLDIHRWPGRYEKTVSLHESCHGRGTGSPAAARRLLATIRGLELVPFDEPEQCCGFGGAFSVAFPAVSTEMGRAKQSALSSAAADEVVSADAGCLMQLQGLSVGADSRTSTRAPEGPRYRHLAEVLRDALEAA